MKSNLAVHSDAPKSARDRRVKGIYNEVAIGNGCRFEAPWSSLIRCLRWGQTGKNRKESSSKNDAASVMALTGRRTIEDLLMNGQGRSAHEGRFRAKLTDERQRPSSTIYLSTTANRRERLAPPKFWKPSVTRRNRRIYLTFWSSPTAPKSARLTRALGRRCSETCSY